jgi:hypothetical protein
LGPLVGQPDYDDTVIDRTFTADDLTALLERFRLQQAGAKSTSEVTQAQTDLLLGRIASLTDALRTAESGDTADLASRLLINDLALVAASLRARANEISASLTLALEGVRGELDA